MGSKAKISNVNFEMNEFYFGLRLFWQLLCHLEVVKLLLGKKENDINTKVFFYSEFRSKILCFKKYKYFGQSLKSTNFLRSNFEWIT